MQLHWGFGLNKVLRKRYLVEFLPKILVIVLLVAGDVVRAEVLESQVKVLQQLMPTQGRAVKYVNRQLISQDGFLWLASQTGLSRYDGYQLVDVEGPDGVFIGQPIVYIYQDKQGFLWISDSNSGLYRLDLATGQYQKMLNENLDAEAKDVVQVDDIVEDSNGDLWLASGQNVRRYERKSGQLSVLFNLANLGYPGNVNALKLLNNKLYVGTSGGMLVYDLKTSTPKFVNHTPFAQPSAKQKNIRSFYLNARGQLLVGTMAGLYQFEPDDPSGTLVAQALANRRIWRMLAYEQQLLVATDQGLWGIQEQSYVAKKLWQFSDDVALGLNDNNIVDLVMDGRHNFWLASGHGGVFYWDPAPSIFNSFKEKLSDDQVWSLAQVEDQQLWAGTRNGLNKLDLNTGAVQSFFKLAEPDPMSTSMIFKLMAVGTDQLLLSSGDPGQSLLLFDLKTESLLALQANDEATQALLSEPLTGFYLDRQQLWLASESDFYLYDLQTGIATVLPGLIDAVEVESMTGFLGFLAGFPEQMLVSSYRQLWLYDQRTGQARLVFGLSDEQTDEDVSVSSWVVDRNQVLWLTIAGFGLVGVDSQSFETKYHFDQNHKLPTNTVYGAQLDDQDQLWLSSDEGLLRLDVDELTFSHYTDADGLSTNDFNGGHGVKPFVKLADGRLVYGSNKGLVWFDPRRLSVAKAAEFEVKITHLGLLSRTLELPFGDLDGQEVVLAYDDKGLQINFSTMRFTDQQQVQYSWSFDGKTRVDFPENGNNAIVLPELKPGHYVFRVMAVDTQTGAKTQSKSIAIVVNTPWWTSNWAYGFYLLVVAFLAWQRWRQIKGYKALIRTHRSVLKEVNEHIEQNEGRIKVALSGSQSGVWSWHSKSNTLDDTRTHELLNDLDLSEPVAMDRHLALIHPEDLAEYKSAWSQLLQGEVDKFDFSFRMKNTDQHWIWYHDIAVVTKTEAGKISRISGSYTDISEQKRAEQVLKDRDKVDKLTGLPNRQSLFVLIDEQIEKAQHSQMSMALLFVDPDNFNHINMTMGFDIGDRVLRLLARKLQHEAGQDCILGRLDGDQFILLWQHFESKRTLEHLASRIMLELAQPMTIEQHSIIIEVSIGISLFPIDGENTTTLVEHANLATCHAQALGGRQYQFFEPKMEHKSRVRNEQEAKIKQGLKNQEFCNYYQPIYELEQGKIVGFELFLRWFKDDGEVASAGEFIQVAEAVGVMRKLTISSLKQGIEDLKRWNTKDDSVYLSLNLSVNDLAISTVLYDIENIISASGLAPSLLHFEITEGTLSSDGSKVLMIMERLIELGVVVAMDNFGTGYASLRNLRLYPVSILKIDPGFIADVGADKDGEAIVESIIDMSRRLNMGCVAGGVETQLQLEFLLSHGCRMAQGYLFAKPMEFADTLVLLQTKARQWLPN